MPDTRKNFSAIRTEGFEAPVTSVYLISQSENAAAELFIIGEQLSSDENSVTYAATDGKATTNYTVREFYPEEPKMKRTAGNGLALSARTKACAAEFAEICSGYTKVYDTLAALAEKNADNKKFAAFLPPVRVMKACSADGKAVAGSTVYIVTEQRDCVLYSDFIEDLKTNPERNPERRFLTHQSLLITLAECLNVFYESNELKLDLGTAVFGIPRKQRDIPTETLMLLNPEAICLHTYEFIPEKDLVPEVQEELPAQEEAPVEEPAAEEERPAIVVPAFSDEEADDAPEGSVNDLGQQPEKTVEVGMGRAGGEQPPQEAAAQEEAPAQTPAEEKDATAEAPAQEEKTEESSAETPDAEDKPADREVSEADAKAENQPAQEDKPATDESAGIQPETEPGQTVIEEAPAEKAEQAQETPAQEAATEEKTAEEPVAEDKPEEREVSEADAKAEEQPEKENKPAAEEAPRAQTRPDNAAQNAEHGNHGNGDRFRNNQNGNQNNRPNGGENRPDNAGRNAEHGNHGNGSQFRNNQNGNQNNRPNGGENRPDNANRNTDPGSRRNDAQPRGNQNGNQNNRPNGGENRPNNGNQNNRPNGGNMNRPQGENRPQSRPEAAQQPKNEAQGRAAESRPAADKPVKEAAPVRENRAEDKPVQNAPAGTPREGKPADNTAMGSFGKISAPAGNKPAENRPAPKKPENKAGEGTAMSAFGKISVPSGKPAENRPAPTPREKKPENTGAPVSSFGRITVPDRKTEAPSADNKPIEKKAENKPAEAKSADKKAENKPAEAKSADKKTENKPAEAKSADKKTENKPAEAKSADKKAENKPAEAKSADKKTENKPAEAKSAEKKTEKKTEKPAAGKTEEKKVTPKKPAAKKNTEKKEAPKTADLAFEPGEPIAELTEEGPEEKLVSPAMEADIKADIRFMTKLFAVIFPEGKKGDASPVLDAGVRTGTVRYRREVFEFVSAVLQKKPEAPATLPEFTAVLTEIRRRALAREIAEEFRPAAVVPVKKLEKITSFLDKKRVCPPEVSFRAMLAAKPVYEKLPAGADTLNLLVIGGGDVLLRFAGEIMENAVSADRKVAVEILSDNADDAEICLRQWYPAFPELCADSEIASFTFTQSGCAESDIKETLHENHYDAVFVRAGTDEMTAAAAKTACAAVSDVPVYVIADNGKNLGSIRKATVFDLSDTSRWDKGINIPALAESNILDFFAELESRRTDIMPVPGESHSVQRFYWEARDYAHALGTDISDVSAAAAAIWAAVNGEKQGAMIKTRHRKWLMKLVFAGWSRLAPTAPKYPFSDISEEEKAHVGLSDCTQEPPRAITELTSLYAHKKLTDKLEINYCTYNKNVGAAKLSDGEKKLFAETCAKATWLLQENKSCSLAFISLKNLTEDARAKKHVSDCEFHRQFDLLLNDAKYLPEDKYALLVSLLNTMQDIFRAAVGTSTMLTYKQRHALALSNIPSVLTKRANVRLAIPFGTNAGADVFGCPSQLAASGAGEAVIVTAAEDGEELACAVNELKKALPGVPGHIKVTLLAAVKSGTVTPGQLDGLTKTADGVIAKIRTVSYEKDSEICPALTAALDAMKVTATEKNGSELSLMLRGCGYYDERPCYTFSSEKKRFTKLSGCDFLGYGHSYDAITVEGMLEYRSAAGIQAVSRQFFAENTILWSYYRKKSFQWKIFCELLDDYNKSSDTVLELRLTDIVRNHTFEVGTYTYFLPGYTFEAVRKVLDGFYRNAVITEPDYVVHWYTDDTVEIIFRSYKAFEPQFDSFFANTGRFQSAERIEVYNVKRNAYVKYDSLNVDMSVSRGSYEDYIARGTWKELGEILRILHDELGFIRSLSVVDNEIRFRYASHDIKKLLISAGSLLENYVYIKCRESGLFDDVRSNVVVNWEDGNPDLQNEFDVVLTKGYRSLFVECKAKRALEQDFYYKLSCLTSRFGVNARAVVVADTGETDKTIIPDNEIKRMRGRAIGVETVFREEDIDNIAQILSDMIDQ